MSKRNCVVFFLLVLGTCYSMAAKLPLANEPWDHFVYSMEWPATVCIDNNITHQHVCLIPANVTTWVVHGLWPTNGTSHNPQFCNASAEYDHSQIVSILDQLHAYWPNLYNDTDPDDFWKHEWDKHGTCSMQWSELDSELKYFSKALEMRKKFNLLEIMKSGGIVPRDAYTYQFPAVLKVLKESLISPTLLCTYDKVTQTQYLGEVEFCLDKAFNVISCSKKTKSQLIQRSVREKTSLFSSDNKIVFMNQQKFSASVTLSSIRACNSHEPIAFPVIHPSK